MTDTAKPPAMNSRDVLEALGGHWNPGEYVHIHEAPESADRSGRKLDALIVSCWRSRGHELDGVEVKVSMSDLKRELDNPAKADWWFDHVHRFWLAAPAPLAERVQTGACDFPTGWGLLACTSDAPPRVLIKPAKHAAKPLSWTTTIGLLRAALGGSSHQMISAEQRGFQRGMAAGRDLAARSGGDEASRQELEHLRRKIADFEAASGIELAGWNAGRIGDQVKLLDRVRTDPTVLAHNIGYSISELERTTRQLRDLASAIAKITGDQPLGPKELTHA